MANFIQGLGGKLVMNPVTASLTPPTETTLLLVTSSPGANEIVGPISAGVDVTIPDSLTYEDTDLQVFLNGQQLDVVSDFNYVGAGPSRTQVDFVFDLLVSDKITFRIDK